jgi:hypothetical protein
MNKTTTLIKNRYTLAEEYVGIEDTFVPARGVTIIYPVKNGYQKVKLGDGVTTLADLPWCGTPGVGGDVELIKVVDSLPETGEENKIYLVPIVTQSYAFPTAEAPGAYTADGTFSNLEYTWDELLTRDSRPFVALKPADYAEIETDNHDIIVSNNLEGADACPFDCNGRNIVLPESVTFVSAYQRSAIGILYIKATTPPELKDTFNVGIDSIVVPQGCGDAYKSAANWSNYADIITEVGNAANTENNLFDEWIWINKGTEDAPEYVWEWITTKQFDVSLYATKEYVDTNKMQVVTTTGTGAAYVATVPGITSLTAGASFVMVPHVNSTATAPTLNVNGLGAKGLRRYTSTSALANSGYSAGWLTSTIPVTVMYSGSFWIVKELTKPSAEDLSGTVSVAKGGTGAPTLKTNAIIAGNGSSAVKTVSTANGALYATASDGAAQFGTLPIAQGGTGATTAAAAVSKLKSALVDLLYPVGSIYMSANSASPSTLFGGTWEAWGQGRVPVGVGSGYAANSTGGAASVDITLTENNMPSHNHVFTPSGSVSSTFTGTASNTTAESRGHTHGIYSDGQHGHTATVYYRPPSGAGGYTAIAGSRDNSSSSSTTGWVSIAENGNHSHGGWTQDRSQDHTHAYTPSGSVSSTFTGTTAGSSSAGSGAAFSVNTMQPYITCYMWKRTA